MKRKKVVCFVHIPKSAGSSVWHTLANLPKTQNMSDIGFADSYFEACRKIESEEPMLATREAIVEFRRILRDFSKTSLRLLFVHHHTPVLPSPDQQFEFDYIFIVRRPEDRLNSALRHWLGGSGEVKTFIASYPDITDRVIRLIDRGHLYKFMIACQYLFSRTGSVISTPFPFSFFDGALAQGVDRFIRMSFGSDAYRKPNFGLPPDVRIFAFNIDELAPDGPFLDFMKREYGFAPPKIDRFSGTVTQGGHYADVQERLKSEVPLFSKVFRLRAKREATAIRCLFKAAKRGTPEFDSYGCK